MFKRIQIPDEGSRKAILGRQLAVKRARQESEKPRGISVVDEFIAMQNFEAGFNTGDLIDALKETGQRTIANAQKLLKRHHRKVETTVLETVCKRVADVMVGDVANCKADLIAMDTHGRRGINRMVLGSDAKTTLRTSLAPVLMIRLPAHRG